MKIQELVSYIKGITDIAVFPLAFPEVVDGPKDACVVQFQTSYTSAKGGMQRVNLQIIVRSDHPETAEANIFNLINHFNRKTSFNVGSTHVIFVDIKSPFPLFAGKDNGGNYRYVTNLTMLVETKK